MSLPMNHMIIGGAVITGVVGLMAANHHKNNRPALDAQQLVRHYSHGGPLGALLGGTAMRLTSLHTTNPQAIAVAAGLGATLGAFVGDRAWAPHAPPALIATIAGLTGAAAVGTRLLSDKYVDRGYLTLRSFIGRNHALDEGLTKALTSVKSLHPIVDSIVSRAGLKGLLTVASIPIAHAMVQRVLTRKYRHAQTFMHSSILQPLSPHPVDTPTSGPKYLPGSKVEGGSLTMTGEVYDHTDEINLHRL